MGSSKSGDGRNSRARADGAGDGQQQENSRLEHREHAMAMHQRKIDLNPVKVPSVQELANMNLGFVPPRYILFNQETLSMSNSTSQTEIPVIDMQQLLSEDHVRMNSELQKLDLACKEWGVFQLINHGVSTSLVEKWKQHTEDLFNLPLVEKSRLQLKDFQGFGHVQVESDEQKLNWGDAFSVTPLPIHSRKLDFFSKLPAPFRETLDEYSAEINSLAMEIQKQMAKALGMKLEDICEDVTQSIRINYYPPCPQPELVSGIAMHSDCTGLTILLQATDVNGLQVRKDGLWVNVSALPNAFTFFIGDILEILTNGIYKSVVHRATVNKEKERITIVAFHSPITDIGPAPSLITPETPAKFKRTSFLDHLNGCFRAPEKSYLDSMRI